MTSRNRRFILMVSLLVFSVVRVCNAEGPALVQNQYETSCPKAEELVRNITWRQLKARPVLAAKLLRLHFHDCFIRGCDGSILLDAVDNVTKAEKDALAHTTLQGYDEIDEIKTEIEKLCPAVVSCADILALAARDSVSFLPYLDYDSIPPFKPLWPVLTGRKDGNISLASEVTGANIPSSFSNFTTLHNLFASKGLDDDDLVALSGAHTIGVARCSLFSNRLYNFTENSDVDPSLNATYAEFLKVQCPPNNRATTVEFDPNSSSTFDSNYFNILLQNKGLMQSDAALLTDKNAEKKVEKLQKSKDFFKAFADSMKKMGNIGAGSAGEIRKQCRLVNPQ
ncbi:hypothetical protein Patl1_25539 [Pistacia atlantica]|uniref:Uncharacterized protein n=1 Tax=Pistacia atlantica TaxID=434234 RepID=A0ACC1B3M0_9ROSI|nr:hypothetical protein Patl1_25539 [Pistacia atlantica]